MFARAEIILATVVPAAFALGLSACDVSQKMPETVSASLVTQRVGDASAEAQASADGKPTADAAGHERSIRLYGPGVSRQRQTRI